MIRRELNGFDWLMTQDDHGILAGLCARHLGNREFARPEPFEPTVSGIRMHDAGWPLHDDQPTVDAHGRPLNVFDRPWPVALEVWGASVDRAEAADPYGGLLASIHAMRITNDLADRDTPAGKFNILKFVHREIERQEQLRHQLGFRTDLPLHFGLAAAGASAQEDQLTYNFHWLQACDLFSLAVLNTTLPRLQTREVQAAPGQPTFTLQLHRPEPTVLTVKPWPFDVPRFGWDVPARRLPSQTYADNATFRHAYWAAEPLTLHVELRAAE